MATDYIYLYPMLETVCYLFMCIRCRFQVLFAWLGFSPAGSQAYVFFRKPVSGPDSDRERLVPLLTGWQLRCSAGQFTG